MNRVSILLQTPAVTLSVFDHPSGEPHSDPPVEQAGGDTINFVETGSFEIRSAGDVWSFEPGTLFVVRREMEFACRHDGEHPTDRCLSVGYAEDAMESLRTAGVSTAGAIATQRTPRQRFLQHRLRTCADDGDAMKLELIAGALFESLAPHARPPRRTSVPVTDVMRRIERACDHIDAAYALPLTLAQLAAVAGMSAYHFARVFRELTGLPPHRYLIAVRLRDAARRLAAGASVTESCYAVGFASLSHFVSSFRRRFGVSPSHFARAPGGREIRAALVSPLWSRRDD